MVIPSNSDLQDPQDVNRFTENDLHKMKKEELMTALNTLIEAERGAAGTNIPTTSLERKLDELIQEIS